MKNALLALILGLCATSAIAHSSLSSTTPTNKGIITKIPTEVLLNFKGKIRLTRIEMTHANHQSVDLDLSGHDGFTLDYAVPLVAMGSGPYSIDWRGLSADGHALSGSFNFIVED